MFFSCVAHYSLSVIASEHLSSYSCYSFYKPP